MHDDYGNQIERIISAQSPQQVRDAATAFTSMIGFRNHGFAMRTVSPVLADGGDFFFFEDFNAAWSRTYASLTSPEVERADARILAARRGLPAAAWNIRGQLSYPLAQDVRMRFRHTMGLRYASDHNLRSGLTVPIPSLKHKWSFLSFTHDVLIDPRELASVLAGATYFAHCLQATLDRLLAIHPPTTAGLTVREQDVLRWCAAGCTTAWIADRMHISESTVNFHIGRAAAKLGVRGRRAASAAALSQGLITL